jgi:hypothetical protein
MVVLYAALALQTGISRALLDEAARDPRLPQRITAEQLATLRDFEQIRVEGDFSVEVIQQADYAIELFSTEDARGDLFARVEAGALLLRGYGHPESARVRIGMPQLTAFSSNFSPLLAITGFSGDMLHIRMETRPGRLQRIELHDNDVTDLQLRIPENSAAVAVQVDRTSFTNGVAILGSARVIISE